tara:strand:- start:737 stop:2527 length:1791 start_codon:yes stop_codon:yes gene_type:complete
MKKIYLSVLLTFFLLNNTYTQLDKRLKGLDVELEKVLKKLEEPGFAVAIVENDEILYSKGFGYRDYENKIRVDQNTLFPIGSATKSFTSSLLGLLRDKEKLDFEDSPIDHINELRFYNSQMNDVISIRDMMSHRTGLPRHDASWYFFSTFSKDSLISRIKHQKPFTSVRNRFYYNNFMFMLQGVIAERITNKTWSENIKEMIFDPLRMNRSSTTIAELENSENAAIGYSEGFKKMDYYKIAAMGPAGSINSSVNEMAKYLIMWINKGEYKGEKILPPNYAEEAISSQSVIGANLPDKKNPGLHLANYGYGWFLSSYKGHYRVEHGGNIDGFSTSASFYPSDKIGIIVLSNQNGSNTPSIVRNIITDRMLDVKKTDWLKLHLDNVKEAELTQKELDKNESSNKVDGTSPSRSLDQFEGKYTNLGYGTFDISVRNDSLFMNIPNKVFWLSHHHYDTFLPLEIKKGKIDFEEEGLLITFYADLLGEIKRLAVPLEPAIEESVFFDRKIKPIDIETSELDKYVGDFKFMENTCKTYIKNDDLYVFIPGQPEYKLKPIDKDLFSLVVQESFKVKFDINKRGEVSHLSFVQPNGTFKYKKAK